MLTNQDISDLVGFRHALHQAPEVSGEEARTARAVVDFLTPTAPDLVVTGLGGHGVAVVFQGLAAGPTVLIRSELDALPIQQISDLPWRSQVPGKAHLCGHDGHTAILTGLARLLSRRRPARGRVVLMFQPAEEDGSGAVAVVADPAFVALAPDWSFALHNLPGMPLGHVSVKAGPVNCASRGMKIRLTGHTSHASTPEHGLSPAPAVARLIPDLTALSQGTVADPDFRLATVTHVRIGEPAFGIAPGLAEVWVTLRTLTDDGMDAIIAAAMDRIAAVAGDLVTEITWHDTFAASVNHPEAVAVWERAIVALGHSRDDRDLPMRASEDFGTFGHVSKSAMIFLGAGEATPMLHNPDYDFPDDLIPVGVRLFDRVVRDLLG